MLVPLELMYLPIKIEMMNKIVGHLGHLGQLGTAVKSRARAVPIFKTAWDKLGHRKPLIYKVSKMSQVSQQIICLGTNTEYFETLYPFPGE
ncbi:hypothetical protein BN59_00391 [Legionella massiliensis]|uniref:Uncharacterized protein n=1 Tax=Legionella massiliensis TaxID=1034943 RepID=A0A078KP21_9GAMM|nr:hypothetical protein BN59_00391 [Legionella massiliensis]CEE11863.1 hypothetical protein BN1094_00391 [Legionella massiliensis]